MSPLAGNRPTRALNKVLLPAPLGPVRRRRSPASRVRSTSSTIATPPRRIVTSRALRYGSPAAPSALLTSGESTAPLPPWSSRADSGAVVVDRSSSRRTRVSGGGRGFGVGARRGFGPLDRDREV